MGVTNADARERAWPPGSHRRRPLDLPVLALAGLLAAAGTLSAQTTGSVLGRVVDAASGEPLRGAEVSVPPLPQRTLSAEDGRFVLVGIPAGDRRVVVELPGYRSVTLDRVQVRAGQQTELRLIELDIAPVALPGVTVEAERVLLIEAEVSASQQVVVGRELRELPVTTVAEAVELTPGVSDGHFRGGRAGQEVYVVDGLELKNQLEASTHGFGLEFSPSALEEVGVVTGGFGAEYGSALSGVVRFVTRRGNPDAWRGRAGSTTDHWAPESLMRGFSGVSISADGPVRFLGEGATLFTDLTVHGMLDADPRARGLTCLRPEESGRDLAVALRAFQESPQTRHLSCPYSSPMLPHQQGDKVIAFARFDRPLSDGAGLTISLLRNRNQHQLYTPEFKYNRDYQLGQRTAGTLASTAVDWAHHQQGRAFQVTARGALMRIDRHLGVVDPWTFTDRTRVAGFGVGGFRFLGEEFVRRPINEQLELGTPVPGHIAPGGSSGSPFGPGAEGIFFTEGTPHIANWSRTDMAGGDLVGQMITSGGHAIRGGASAKLYRIETYERILAHLPGSTPNYARFFPATVNTFAEARLGALDRATVSFGARIEAFRAGLRFREDRHDYLAPEIDTRWQFSFMPRLGAALPSQDGRSAIRFNFGMVAQPPDFRYFVDGSLGDSLRTDIHRQGNPNLSFERGSAYELGVRHQVDDHVAIEATAFRKSLGNLITGELTLATTATRQVTTGESGTVNGAELLLRGRWPGLELRASYGLQKAVGLLHLVRDDRQDGDARLATEIPLAFDRRHAVDAAAFAGTAAGDPERRWGVSATARIRSGYPLEPQRLVIIDPQDLRRPLYLPWNVMLSGRASLDVPELPGCARCNWRVVADGRNLLGRQNVRGLRRETGLVAPEMAHIWDVVDAVPPPAEWIPKESPLYSPTADFNGDGYISPDEFRLARLGAAMDRYDPSLFMGEARQLRIGVEVGF